MEVLLYFLILWALVVDTITDHNMIRQGRWVKHLRGAAVAGFAAVLIALLAAWPWELDFWLWLGRFVALRIMLFDALLNFLRKLPLGYVSEEDGAAFTDRILRAIPINPFVLRLIVGGVLLLITYLI